MLDKPAPDITLRDFFAAAALAGFAARVQVDGSEDHVARLAVKLADAMMKARWKDDAIATPVK